MRNINLRLIYVALLLLLLFFSAFFAWEYVKFFIVLFLKSPILTVSIWFFLTIIAIVHYINNINKEPNSINDKEGLEKPMDYLQFVGTYATILSSAQTFAKEFFMQWNFPNETNCKNFNDFDKICIISCVFVLVYYSFIKIAPICSEAFKKKSPVTSDNNN